MSGKIRKLTLMLSLILSLTLVACRGSGDNISKQDETETKTEETEIEEVDETETEEKETEETDEAETETETEEVDTTDENTTENETEKPKETEKDDVTKEGEQAAEHNKPVETKPKPKETEKTTVEETQPPKYESSSGTKYTTNALNVRSGPSTDFGKIGRLAKGQKVEIKGVSGSWYVINYQGKDGFISGSYLTDTQPKPEPKPEPTPQPEPKPEPTPPSSGREVPSGIPSGASYVSGDDQTHTFNYSSNLPNGGSVKMVSTSFNIGEVIIRGTDNSGRGFGAVYKRSSLGFMYGAPDLDDADKSALRKIGSDFLSAYGK